MQKRGEIVGLSSTEKRVPVLEEESYQVLETALILNGQGVVLELGLM